MTTTESVRTRIPPSPLRWWHPPAAILQTHPVQKHKRQLFDVVNDDLVTIGHVYVTPENKVGGRSFPDRPVSSRYGVKQCYAHHNRGREGTIWLNTIFIQVDGQSVMAWHTDNMIDALRLIERGRMVPVEHQSC